MRVFSIGSKKWGFVVNGGCGNEHIRHTQFVAQSAMRYTKIFESKAILFMIIVCFVSVKFKIAQVNSYAIKCRPNFPYPFLLRNNWNGLFDFYTHLLPEKFFRYLDAVIFAGGNKTGYIHPFNGVFDYRYFTLKPLSIPNIQP